MKITSTHCGFALLALVVAIPAVAQINPVPKMDQAAIQRSWDIQAQVAKIDHDKETFINNLIASWTGNVDPALFGNVSRELRPLMEDATAWRLYAASLVGDYSGMIQVLRGEVPASKVINALSAPQPHAMATSALTIGSPSPLASVSPQNNIGAATNQLVFTPIPPCRIADTRGTGARTGFLNPGVPRTFDLTTDAYTKGQGGQTASNPCPGLPSFSFYGWSVNLTATGYTTTGFVQVYPYLGSVPATSILNFGPALPAIANSTTLTGCYGCADDINLVASAQTNIIIDVYGYFEVPTGFTTGAITLMAGASTNVAAGIYSYVPGGTCPAGTHVIGGAQTNSSSSANTILTSDHYADTTDNWWYEYVKNTGTSTASVIVYSICQDLR